MMLRFSTKTIVIVAALCFAGLVLLQLAWMQSAYQNQTRLANDAKKQFVAALQTRLSGNDSLKSGLIALMDRYNEVRHLDAAQMDWFYYHFIQDIQFAPGQFYPGIALNGLAIARMDSAPGASGVLVPVIPNTYSAAEMEAAEKLCIPCILTLTGAEATRYNYQLLLFYKNQWESFFENLGFLILVSLLLLILLGVLFRDMMTRYNQEKKLSEAKNDFINNLTHELQTPVFAIQLANRLISEKSTGQPDLAPLTRIIEKETGQLKMHAGKILSLASLEQGHELMNPELTELNSFIEQRRATMELMLEVKGGLLEVQPSYQPLYCMVDPVHFHHVLLSLVENAIKYSIDQPRVRMETGLQQEGWVFLQIKDNGIGIDRSYLPFIFEKFFRVPHVKRKGIKGLGLGLSYVQQIVNLHEGKVTATSEPGKGTIFTIQLPRANEDA